MLCSLFLIRGITQRMTTVPCSSSLTVLLVNHALFPLLFAPETKVAVLTKSSQTVVRDLRLDTFFLESLNIFFVICSGSVHCDAAVLPVLQYRSFVTLWL